MKIFAIKSDHTSDQILGYLFYYEDTKQFFIELPETADEWDTPLLLSSFVKRGQYTVNSYWSNIWVQQRIIPSNRQNIGSILKENGLDMYDEYALLTLSEGRCAQDDCYIVAIEEKDLPKEILDRFSMRVEEAVPMENMQMMVFFRNSEMRKCDMRALCPELRFAPILKNMNLFNSVQIQTDGYGITWGENLDVGADRLYHNRAG